MKAQGVLLWFAAATFGAFGIWLTWKPEMLEQWLGIVASTPAARVDLRAFYGGFELGLAAFFAIAAMRPTWRRPACAALGCASLGLAIVRGASMLVSGADDGFLVGALALETLLGVLGLALAARP